MNMQTVTIQRGGHNKLNLDEAQVIEVYSGFKSLRKTAKEFGCSTPVIVNILKNHDIERDGCAMQSPERRKRQSEIMKRQHERGMFAGEKHSQWKGGKVKRYCCICGFEIDRWPGSISSNYLCGDECRKEFAKPIGEANGFGTFKGENHYAYGLTGENHPSFKGYKSINSEGYVQVYVEKGVYKLEHRLIVSEFLNRELKDTEIIHHINGIKDDNRLDNLYLFEKSGAHVSYHENFKNGNAIEITESNLSKYLGN